MPVRPYQAAASVAIRAGWAEGFKSQLLVLPTGTGKTVVFAREIEHEVQAGSRCLVIAHREELLQQAQDKLHKATGLFSAIEKAGDRASRTEPVVIASVQTLCREDRLARFNEDHFGLVIIDEAHRTLAESYQKILAKFKTGGARFLGVTATPDRGDRRNLGAFFERVAFEYSMVQAVKDGYLSRPKVKTLPIQIDLSKVAVRTGDFAEDEMGKVLEPMLGDIARVLWTEAKGRKLLVFMPTIATSQMLAYAMKTAGWNADWIAGISEDRREKLAAFRNGGPGTALCNAMLLTEGYDEPTIDAICVLRATKVRSLYAQMVGRGTRISAGKSDLLILDFLWHATRHVLIKPAHLVSKNDQIAQIAFDRGDGDLVANCEAAEQKHLKALEKQLAALAKRKSKMIDPLDLGTLLNDLDTAEYVVMSPREEAPVADYQIKRLEKAGLNVDSIKCWGHADHVLKIMNDRFEAKLGTLKQVRVLKKYGYEDSPSYSFAECNRKISRLAMNNWRRPDEPEALVARMGVPGGLEPLNES